MTDTITMPQSEFAAYQRAVESAKDRIALLSRERDEARGERDDLRAEILRRAVIDADDMHRLQTYTAGVARERDDALRRLAQADAMTRQVLADLETARSALDQIDRHVIGVCASAFGSPEPCEECGEMQEIAMLALRALKAGGT